MHQTEVTWHAIWGRLVKFCTIFGRQLTYIHPRSFWSFAYNCRAPKKNQTQLATNHQNDGTSFSLNINKLSSRNNEYNGNRNFYSVQNRYFRVLLPLFLSCCLFIVFVRPLFCSSRIWWWWFAALKNKWNSWSYFHDWYPIYDPLDLIKWHYLFKYITQHSFLYVC
jgi:hypothetical protein